MGRELVAVIKKKGGSIIEIEIMKLELVGYNSEVTVFQSDHHYTEVPLYKQLSEDVMNNTGTNVAQQCHS